MVMTVPFPNELLYFESIDLLRRRFDRAHGRTLSAGKAHEIASHFRQGREFHETARGAPLLVKPLLLYYSVLAWTRGVILFLDPKARESSLRKSHGLAAHDWQAVLAQKNANLGDLEVRFESGTFSQLTSATRNTEGFRGGVHRPLLYQGTSKLPLGSTVKAREVWARLAGLAGVYEETFGEPSYVYEGGEALTRPGGGSALYLTPVSRNAAPIPVDTLRSQLILPHHMGIRAAPWPRGHDYELILRDEALARWHQILWGGDDLIVAPFAGDLRLSMVSMMFLNAYILGMLVRYHPTVWNELVHRGSNDAAMPIVREATGLLESEFPRLLLSSIVVTRDPSDVDVHLAADHDQQHQREEWDERLAVEADEWVGAEIRAALSDEES